MKQMIAHRWNSRKRATAARRQRGATVVEMALVMPVFLLVMIGVIELAMMYFSNLTMQYAVREGSRYAITGLADADPNASNQQRYQAIIQKIKDSSTGMYAKVSPVITTNNVTYTDSSSYNAAMFGAAGDILVIQIDCYWPLATPLLKPFFTDGKYHFVVATTMLNENYGSN
ncbi:TadE/TadG family type IV pilus assembly protein [Rugamonas aquatica]|nr:TadE/TadG family type IV pilus assembly protein [Rugamonas aquatica]